MGWSVRSLDRQADHRSGIAPNPEGKAYSIGLKDTSRVLTLVLTRHGRTSRSVPEQYLGQHIDVPLDRRGKSDAGKLARRLESVAIERVVSSPLLRARNTAEIVAAPHAGLKVEIDKRLIELDYGAWEGHTIEEIRRLFPGQHEKYERDPATFDVGGAESGREVAQRLRPLIDELLDWSEKKLRERICLVVGHSSTNRVLLAMSLGIKLADYRRRIDQDWTNLTVLQWADRASGPTVRLLNDVSHARGIRGVTWG